MRVFETLSSRSALTPAVLSLLALLSACQPARQAAEQAGAESEAAQQSAAQQRIPTRETAWERDFARQRIIGDLLYDALRALEDDRLLTPPENSAHARYQRVLALDPGNELALEGLNNIVLRYLELAEESSRQGRFENAVEMIERARFVNEGHPAIDPAWQAVQNEMKTGDLFFDLDLSELNRQSAGIQSKIADIAEQAREHQAFFLITAPSDMQARWIFAVMRDAVEGYRLRGNIELGSRAAVRLRMPEQAVTDASDAAGDVTGAPSASGDS